LKTQFLIEAEERGATVVDGLGMLLHQAAPGFERWFGQRPEVDDLTRAAVLSA
jgi:shikimate dehydrogenase